MSLKRRPIDRFKLICFKDEALDSLPEDVIKAYADSGRDWEVIAPHVDGLDPKPQIFVCDPLKPQYDSQAVTGAVDDFKVIFGGHVKDIINADESVKPQLTKSGDRTYLELDYVNTIPLDWIIDVAGAIINRGFGDTTPFSLPVGYWQRRTRRLVLRRAATIGRAVHSTTIASADNGNPSPNPSTSNAG